MRNAGAFFILALDRTAIAGAPTTAAVIMSAMVALAAAIIDNLSCRRPRRVGEAPLSLPARDRKEGQGLSDGIDLSRKIVAFQGDISLPTEGPSQGLPRPLLN